MDIPFLVAILSYIGSIAAGASAWLAARFGYKVALIAIVAGVFVSIWLGAMALLSSVAALFPASSGLPALALSALPDKGSVAAAWSLYLGTRVTLKSYDFWKLWLGIAAQMGAS